MKLAKSDLTAVNEAMRNIKDGAGLSFEEFIACWMKRDAKPAIFNTRNRYPKLTDQELEWKIRFGWISDWPNGWLLRGVARRFATGNLDEFGSFVQMHARQAILNHCANEDEYTDIWPLLTAIAIQDEPAITHFVKNATFPIKTGHADTRHIYNCVLALLGSRTSELEKLIKKRPTEKRPDWLEGIVACLAGVISQDASQVASGLEAHLKGFKKAKRINPLEKIISLEAHGLYRLVERIDPKLLANCDIQRTLPWDRAFHDWSCENQPKFTKKDFARCPEPLAKAFVTLNRPAWMS